MIKEVFSEESIFLLTKKEKIAITPGKNKNLQKPWPNYEANNTAWFGEVDGDKIK